MPTTIVVANKRLWTPAQLSPTGWWDCADTATITDAGGGAVSQLSDKSGNSNHLLQGTAGNRPITGTRTINGRNGLDLQSGSLHYLEDSSLVLAQPFTVLAVAQTDVTSGNRHLFECGTAGIGYTNVYIQNTPFYWAQNAASGYVSTTTASSGVPYNVVSCFNAASSQFYINNVALGNTTGTRTCGQMRMGISRDTLDAWDGIYGELVIMAGAITAAQRQEWANYCCIKWGTTG